MKYVIVDEDGQLRQRTAPRYDVALRDVGPEGSDRVGLPNAAAVYGPEHVRTAAYVNGVSALPTSPYQRNLVGSCLLASLGAVVRPYYGPIVIVGWDPEPGPDVEVVSLTDGQIQGLRQMYDDIRVVLRLVPGRPSGLAVPRWQDAMRAVAEHVRTGPAPRLTVLTDDEALAHLLGRRR
ncbi:hypothetical protein ABZS66_19060 [Dactylosporangium sp. NPDC005572]|uniref:hypothetical protein n=1 Tax=Dactylosporangium sp. NPDC005572 TaxID=3156889 RepID=UPI0033BA99C6